jgi:predicted Fe-Mo cluster-binding NifX family protein
MEILGLVENMSGLVCPYCGKTIDIFKTKGGILTAKNEGLRLLGTLPLDPQVVSNGDAGDMGLLDRPDLPIILEFNKIVDTVIQLSETQETVLPETRKNVLARKKSSPDAKMIAVPMSGGKLSAKFGLCEQFAFIETQDGKIIGKEMLTSPAHASGVLPQWLKDQGADVVIAGKIGEKAQELLRNNGIEVIINAPMDAPESLVNQYLAKTLLSEASVCDH